MSSSQITFGTRVTTPVARHGLLGSHRLYVRDKQSSNARPRQRLGRGRGGWRRFRLTTLFAPEVPGGQALLQASLATPRTLHSRMSVSAEFCRETRRRAKPRLSCLRVRRLCCVLGGWSGDPSVNRRKQEEGAPRTSPLCGCFIFGRRSCRGHSPPRPAAREDQ